MRRFLTQLRIENRLFLRDYAVVGFHMCLPLLCLGLLTRVEGNMVALRWTVGLVDPTGSSFARQIAGELARFPGVSLVEGDLASMRALAATGRLGALVLLDTAPEPEDGTVRIEGDSQAGAVARAAVLSVVAARGAPRSAVLGPARPAAPISAEAAITAVILPGVVGMVVASVGLFGFGVGIASYRERGFLSRLAVTPLGVRRFLVAQTAHRLLFILAQSGLLILVGRRLLGAGGGVRLVDLTAVLASGSLVFLALGFLIGGVASNGQLANGLAHLLYFPMLLLSGAFYPVTALPGLLRPIAPFLPMTYFLEGLQRALGGIGGVGWDVGVLGVWAAFASTLSLKVFSTE